MEHEEQLKIELSKGKHSAFEIIFKEFHGQLYRYSLAIIKDEEEAKEIAQQTLVQLWEKRESASAIKSLQAFLMRSAHNICINKFQHSKVREQYASEEGYRLQFEFVSQFENTYDTNLKEKIKSAAEALPTKNKEVFMLRYFDGLDTEEVSSTLGITPRTVETHISNAFKLLREKLSPILGTVIVFISLIIKK